ncbi:hypothetical protein Tco_0778370 [Tanacetum coccineum]
MIKDFDNIAFGKVMTMAVSEHFLHTKQHKLWLEDSFHVEIKRTDSPRRSVKMSWGEKNSANEKRNGDCGTGSQSDNTVGSPHWFIIHWIIISKNIKKVTEVTDVENWRIDNSRVLRWIVSLIEWNSSVSSTKSSIKSTFRFCESHSSVNCVPHPKDFGTTNVIETHILLRGKQAQYRSSFFKGPATNFIAYGIEPTRSTLEGVLYIRIVTSENPDWFKKMPRGGLDTCKPRKNDKFTPSDIDISEALFMRSENTYAKTYDRLPSILATKAKDYSKSIPSS